MLRLVGAAYLMLFSAVVSHAQLSEDAISKLPSDHQAWVNRSCPKSLPPPIRTSCIAREASAVSPGIPDLSSLSPAERDWILRSCPTGWLPPSVALSCLNRELKALSEGVPSLIDLTSRQRERVQHSCPRALPPSFYRSCVARETGAARGVARAPTAGSMSSAPAALGALPASQTTKPVLHTDAYASQASRNDEVFVIKREKYEVNTNCFSLDEDDPVLYVEGSESGACLSAVIVNQRTDQQCEVWCEPLDEQAPPALNSK